MFILFTHLINYESKQVVLLKLDPLFCVFYLKGLHLYVVKYDLNHLGNDSSDKKKIPSNISFTEVPYRGTESAHPRACARI